MKRMIVIIICITSLCGCSKASVKEEFSSVPMTEYSITVSSSTTEESDTDEQYTAEILPEHLYEVENIDVIIDNYSSLSIEAKQEMVDSWSAPVDFKVQRNEENPQQGDILITGKYESYVPRINNQLALRELLTEETPLRFLGPFLRDSYGGNYAATFGMMCNGFSPCIPMTFFRQVDDNHYYTVTKIKDAGYLYVFFEQKDNAIDATDITDVGAVYIEKTLSYKDFEGINVGSSIDDVRNIDSGIYAWELAREVLYEDCRTDPYNKDCLPGTDQPCDYNSKVSIHLLTDGLLTIVYEKNGDSWIITDMKLSEDFIFDSSITPYTINEKQFKILPQDYPPAS